MKALRNNKGFSLVEMLIAIAISAVIASALFALMSYASNSMNQTQAKVALGDEAKDIVNHITGYAMEASDAVWSDGGKVLLIKNEAAAEPEKKEVIYWRIGENLFFASITEVSPDALPDDKQYLLGEQVEDFEGSIDYNTESNKKLILVNIKLKNAMASFECNNQIFIRNQ